MRDNAERAEWVEHDTAMQVEDEIRRTVERAGEVDLPTVYRAVVSLVGVDGVPHVAPAVERLIARGEARRGMRPSPWGPALATLIFSGRPTARSGAGTDRSRAESEPAGPMRTP